MLGVQKLTVRRGMTKGVNAHIGGSVLLVGSQMLIRAGLLMAWRNDLGKGEPSALVRGIQMMWGVEPRFCCGDPNYRMRAKCPFEDFVLFI